MLTLAVLSLVSAYVVATCAGVGWVRANRDRFVLAAGQEKPIEVGVLLAVGGVLLLAGGATIWEHYEFPHIGFWAFTAAFFALFATPCVIHNLRLRRQRAT